MEMLHDNIIPQSVFIRHKLSSTPEILEDLWSKRLIAIHYANISSTKPEDYKKAGKASLEKLWRYCETGAIVGATYTSLKPASMLVGIISPGSKVEIIEYDYIYKTVRLRHAREIFFSEHPLLAAIQPRQGTITGWPSAVRYLIALLKNEELPSDVRSLAPSQLEVVCYEYLRMKEIMSFLLMPIGRTMRDIDIYGINSKNETIMAQVTQDRDLHEIERKINCLKCQRSKNAKLIFFGPQAHKRNDPVIEYISVEDAFEEVKAKYPLLISRMLGQKKSRVISKK
jgi:hypothetical protein